MPLSIYSIREAQNGTQKLRWWLAIFGASLGMLFLGFADGVINAPQAIIEKFLKGSFEERYGSTLSDEQAAIYFGFGNTVVLVGGTVSSPFAGMIANRWGRKRGLLLAQIPAVAGTLLTAAMKPASSYEMMVAGRFLVGLACGLFSILSPMYVSEISPVKLHGIAGCINLLAYSSGLLLSGIFGLSTALGTPDLWPVLIALGTAPSVLQAAILPLVPETPEYLVRIAEDPEGGREAIASLHGPEAVGEMMEEIRSGAGGERAISAATLLRTRKYWLPLAVAVAMHLSLVMSGVNGLIYFSTTFFQRSGIPCDISQYSTMIIAVLDGLSMMTAGPIIDSVGRRGLQLCGMGAAGALLVCVTVAQNLVDEGATQDCSTVADAAADTHITFVGIFLISCTLLFTVACGLGPGSVPWIITSELFDGSSRGAAASVVLFAHWGFGLVSGLVFPALLIRTQTMVFVPFSAITAVLFVFLLVYLPETKGRTPKTLDKLFAMDNVWRKPIGLRGSHYLDKIASQRSTLGAENHGYVSNVKAADEPEDASTQM